MALSIGATVIFFNFSTVHPTSMRANVYRVVGQILTASENRILDMDAIEGSVMNIFS